jgi:hypothetical protein
MIGLTGATRRGEPGRHLCNGNESGRQSLPHQRRALTGYPHGAGLRRLPTRGRSHQFESRGDQEMLTLVAGAFLVLVVGAIWGGLRLRKQVEVLQAEIDIVMGEIHKLRTLPALSK